MGPSHGPCSRDREEHSARLCPRHGPSPSPPCVGASQTHILLSPKVIQGHLVNTRGKVPTCFARAGLACSRAPEDILLALHFRHSASFPWGSRSRGKEAHPCDAGTWEGLMQAPKVPWEHLLPAPRRVIMGHLPWEEYLHHRHWQDHDSGCFSRDSCLPFASSPAAQQPFHQAVRGFTLHPTQAAAPNCKDQAEQGGFCANPVRTHHLV